MLHARLSPHSWPEADAVMAGGALVLERPVALEKPDLLLAERLHLKVRRLLRLGQVLGRHRRRVLTFVTSLHFFLLLVLRSTK